MNITRIGDLVLAKIGILAGIQSRFALANSAEYADGVSGLKTTRNPRVIDVGG